MRGDFDEDEDQDFMPDPPSRSVGEVMADISADYVENLRAEIDRLRADQERMREVRAYLDEHEKVASLTARCEALQDQLNNHCACEHDGRGELVSECDEHQQIRERCEALTAERDQLAKAIAPTCDTVEDRELFTLDELVKTARNHRELTNDECETIRSRCQHLEQAVKDLAAQVRQDFGMVTADGSTCGIAVARLDTALASLLPAQEETPGTDENRVSFAAGYTAALDDALKGK